MVIMGESGYNGREYLTEKCMHSFNYTDNIIAS